MLVRKNTQIMGLRRSVTLLLVASIFTGTTLAASSSHTPGEGDSEQPTATIIINEKLFSALLEAVFSQLKAPTYPLKLADNRLPPAQNMKTAFAASATDECQNVIELKREVDGVKTAVSLKNGRINAPLAFRGTYYFSLVGCVTFQGWADTKLSLYFDQGRQTLSGRINVEDIHLTGLPSIAGGAIVPLVQNSIDQRINPVQILQASQLSASVPIAASGGVLKMRARSVTPEVMTGELRLRIVYDFARE